MSCIVYTLNAPDDDAPTGNILDSKCRLSGTVFVYEMLEQMGIELDEPIDWIIMEQLLVASQAKNSVTNKTFCFDIDGVIGKNRILKI